MIFGTNFIKVSQVKKTWLKETSRSSSEERDARLSAERNSEKNGKS